MITVRVSDSLDPDQAQHSDLGQNCFQRLYQQTTQVIKSRRRVNL